MNVQIAAGILLLRTLTCSSIAYVELLASAWFSAHVQREAQPIMQTAAWHICDLLVAFLIRDFMRTHVLAK